MKLQGKFLQSVDSALANAQRGTSEDLTRDSLAQHQLQWEVCWAEFELLKRMQMQDMEFVRQLETQVVEERQSLFLMESGDAGRKGVGGLRDKLPGQAPQQKRDRKRDRIDSMMRTLRATLREVAMINAAMHKIIDAVGASPTLDRLRKEYPRQYPVSTSDLASSAEGLVWPGREMYAMYFSEDEDQSAAWASEPCTPPATA